MALRQEVAIRAAMPAAGCAYALPKNPITGAISLYCCSSEIKAVAAPIPPKYNPVPKPAHAGGTMKRAKGI
nr:hypothetical protein [Nostoc sp. CmiSLP01]MDZ8288674.1 hypothetical protein [Nostoc sp. ChiSLP01]